MKTLTAALVFAVLLAAVAAMPFRPAPRPIAVAEDLEEPAPQVGGFSTCYICQFLFNYAKDYVQQNQTIDQIESALKFVCDLAPGSFDTVCKSFVTQYTPRLVNLILAGVDGTKACKELGLCSSKSMNLGEEDLEFVKAFMAIDEKLRTLANEQLKAPKKDSTTCSICMMMVGFAENYLKNNATQQQIIDALDKICAMTPFEQQCDAAVAHYVPYVINLLSNGYPPSEVCGMLGLCDSAVASFKRVLPTAQF
ncbi:Prosaposin [Balamuthia mandrillaris]